MSHQEQNYQNQQINSQQQSKRITHPQLNQYLLEKQAQQLYISKAYQDYTTLNTNHPNHLHQPPQFSQVSIQDTLNIFVTLNSVSLFPIYDQDIQLISESVDLNIQFDQQQYIAEQKRLQQQQLAVLRANKIEQQGYTVYYKDDKKGKNRRDEYEDGTVYGNKNKKILVESDNKKSMIMGNDNNMESTNPNNIQEDNSRDVFSENNLNQQQIKTILNKGYIRIKNNSKFKFYILIKTLFQQEILPNKKITKTYYHQNAVNFYPLHISEGTLIKVQSQIKYWYVQCQNMLNFLQIKQLMNAQDKDQILKNKILQLDQIQKKNSMLNSKNIKLHQFWYTSNHRFVIWKPQDILSISKTQIQQTQKSNLQEPILHSTFFSLYNHHFTYKQTDILDFSLIWYYFQQDQKYQNSLYYLHPYQNNQQILVYKAGKHPYRISLIQRPITLLQNTKLKIISTNPNNSGFSKVCQYKSPTNQQIILKGFYVKRNSAQFEWIVRQVIIGKVFQSELSGPKFKSQNNGNYSFLSLFYTNDLNSIKMMGYQNLINLKQTSENQKNKIFYFEMNPYEDLRKLTNSLSQSQFLSHIYPTSILQLTKKLNIIHQRNLIHGDIKPQNMLYTQLQTTNGFTQNYFCFNDFQTSCFLNDDNTPIVHFFGTPAYMSPQMYNLYEKKEAGRVNLYSNDIYSLVKSLKNLAQQRLKQSDTEQKELKLGPYQQFYMILNYSEQGRIQAFKNYLKQVSNK